MFLVRCDGCHNSTFTEDTQGFGAALVCPPGTDCCQEDHDHDAASACAKDHKGACAKENPDCAVCRPITITVVPGAVTLSLAAG